jgi:hypothetical protein
MNIATQRPVSLRVGEFSIETLGVEYPDYFQGFGLGPRSEFNYCAYGIGDTEEEAFQDCLEMVAQQGFEVDDETEARIARPLADWSFPGTRRRLSAWLFAPS